MKSKLLIGSFILVAALILYVGCKPKVQKEAALETDKQKLSYALGQQIGKNMKQGGIDIDPQIVGASIGDALSGKESRLTDEQMAETMKTFQQQMMAKQQAAMQKGKGEGAKFLEENKKKEGIKVTKSGLQYKVLKEGKGSSPKATDKVEVHYRGTLTDGKEFDSSFKRNKPAQFQVGQVIPGWTEALQLMKPGAKWQLFIPSELAYGPRATGSIPANSVLIFEVDLLKIL